MRNDSSSDRSPAAHDGAPGFVSWIIVYVILLLALIAVSGGPQLFSYDHLGWML